MVQAPWPLHPSICPTFPPPCLHSPLANKCKPPFQSFRKVLRLLSTWVGWMWISAASCLMVVVSYKHNLNLMMFIIDDFSGYIWCIPLCSKSNAFSTLQTWHKAITVQSGNTLHILITDNSKLVSNAMQTWCNAFGIDPPTHSSSYIHTEQENGTAPQDHHWKRLAQRKLNATPLGVFGTIFVWLLHAYLTCLTAATS